MTILQRENIFLEREKIKRKILRKEKKSRERKLKERETRDRKFFEVHAISTRKQSID